MDLACWPFGWILLLKEPGFDRALAPFCTVLGLLPQQSCGVCGGRALAPFCTVLGLLPQHSCGVCGGRALAPFAFVLGLLLQDSCGVCGSRAWHWTFLFP